jgi:hypothetical protein
VKFDLRRARPAEWLALISAAILAASLFMPWYTVAGRRMDAWQTLTVIDWLLAVVALIAFGLFATTVTQRSPTLPVAMSVWTTLAGLVGTLSAAVRTIVLPAMASDRCYGVWVALGAAFAVLVAGVLAMRDESPYWGAPAHGGKAS